MKPHVVSEEPMNMAQLKDVLAKVKKRDDELNYRANKTQEYVEQFVEITVKQAEEEFKKLEGLGISRLKDVHFHKLIDVRPQSPEEVKAILQGYNISVSQDNLKKIVGVF